MAMLNLLGPSAYDNDADEILERYDMYIVALAQKRVPQNCVRIEALHDEIDELAQNVRIKFWLAIQKKRINNPQAYIRSIVYTEVVNITRRSPSALPFPLNKDGELYQCNPIIVQSQEMQDPICEVEQKEAIDELLEEATEEILRLPPQQQRAMICSLKEHLDDSLLVLNALGKHVDIEEIRWPEKGKELRSLRSSLSVARKKLQTVICE